MTPKHRQRIAPWLQPSSEELPGSIGIDLVLGVSDQAVVYLTRPASYANALRFDMIAVPRTRSVDPSRFLMLMSIGEPPADGTLPDEFLRFGVEFADGRHVSNLDRDELNDPPEIALWELGGDSEDSYCRYEWYLWPLPEEGDLVFVCEWPAFGIVESRAILSGDSVRAAAARARDIWNVRR